MSGIRIAPRLAWWERLIERTGYVERWEYWSVHRWVRYWRHDGSIPAKARWRDDRPGGGWS